MFYVCLKDEQNNQHASKNTESDDFPKAKPNKKQDERGTFDLGCSDFNSGILNNDGLKVYSSVQESSLTAGMEPPREYRQRQPKKTWQKFAAADKIFNLCHRSSFKQPCIDGLTLIRSVPRVSLPREYESIIQKLEGEVRNHIRIEQQMKIHIDTMVAKMEELERKYQKDLKDMEVKHQQLSDLLGYKDEEIKGLVQDREKQNAMIGLERAKMIEIEKQMKELAAQIRVQQSLTAEMPMPEQRNKITQELIEIYQKSVGQHNNSGKPSRPQSKTMLLAPLPDAKHTLEKDKQAKIFKELLLRTVSNLNKSNSRTRVTDYQPSQSKSPTRYLSIDQSQQRPAKAQSFTHKRSLSHTHNNSQGDLQNPYSMSQVQPVVIMQDQVKASFPQKKRSKRQSIEQIQLQSTYHPQDKLPMKGTPLPIKKKPKNDDPGKQNQNKPNQIGHSRQLSHAVLGNYLPSQTQQQPGSKIKPLMQQLITQLGMPLNTVVQTAAPTSGHMSQRETGSQPSVRGGDFPQSQGRIQGLQGGMISDHSKRGSTTHLRQANMQQNSTLPAFLQQNILATTIGGNNPTTNMILQQALQPSASMQKLGTNSNSIPTKFPVKIPKNLYLGKQVQIPSLSHFLEQRRTSEGSIGKVPK